MDPEVFMCIECQTLAAEADRTMLKVIEAEANSLKLKTAAAFQAEEEAKLARKMALDDLVRHKQTAHGDLI